ncbi:MAG: ABC transporter permease [Thermoprotei archaeon]|nr:MAG: ABC transporter permease [Thermoprotei archaeon]
MKISDVVRLAFKALTEKKLRAVLTIVGISIGPLALIAIYGVTSGYGDYVVREISGLGQNLVVVMPGEEYELSEEDLRFLSGIEGVVDASPFYGTQAEFRRLAGEADNVFVYAVEYEFLFKAIPSLVVERGGIPSETDITKCILGHDLAYSSETLEHDVGDAVSVTVYRTREAGKIEAKRITLIVAGILEKYGGAAILNPDETVFISMETAEKLLGIREWSGILLLASEPSLVPSITQKIREHYGNAVTITAFYAIAEIASSITGAVNFMTFSATLAAFAVAVAGVAATMITSVIERTREIGVLKALGFTDAQVIALIIAEGVLMSLIGAIIGIAVGVAVAYILASHGLTIRAGMTSITIQASPNISPQLVASTITLTILVGILGSIFPAYRAAKIPPAVALRYE